MKKKTEKKESLVNLCEMTDQQIENQYAGNDALISVKKFEKIKLLINQAYKDLDEFKGEDISVFVGNSRSGKSTVINTILDNKLFAKLNKRKTYISTEQDQEGPEIGNESVSKTKVPSRYKTKDFGVVWDCPGYGDNRGDTQDIVNNFCIKKLLEDAKSMKLFIVSDISDIDVVGVSGLISLTKSIDLSFGENSEMDGECVLRNLMHNKAIGMIVTKSYNEDTEDEIKELYKTDFLDVTGISKAATADELISYFVGKIGTMCITPKIEKEHLNENGQVDIDCLKDPILSLFSSLRTMKIDENFSIRPGLSPSAQKFIYSCYTDDGMLSQFKDFFKLMETKSSSYMSSIDLKDKDLLGKLLLNINDKIEFINKFVEDLSSFNSLKDLVVSIKNSLPSFLDPVGEGDNQKNMENYIEKYFEERDMVSQAAFLDFLASSVLKVNSSLRPVVEKFLYDLKSNYNKDINFIHFTLGEIKENEYKERQNELIEERKQVETDYKKQLKLEEEQRVKQAENFLKQQKEDLAKHKEEQDRIRFEMSKQLEEEKFAHEKEMKKKSAEWDEIQEKLVAKHAKDLNDMNESHVKEVSVMRQEQKDLEEDMRKERVKFKKKIDKFVSDKKISGEALQVVTKAMDQMKLDRETDRQTHKEQMDRMNQMVEDLKNKPPQVVEKIIIEKESGICPIFFSLSPKYDNPLLNDNELMKNVKNELGGKVFDKFVDLCSNLTDEEYNQVASSDDVIGCVRDLIGFSDFT